MYVLKETTKFKRDLKRISKKSQAELRRTFDVLKILKKDGVLGVPVQMKPHKLKGKYKDNWECHIRPDLLIIWFQIEEPKVIKLIRIGSHSDLFK